MLTEFGKAVRRLRLDSDAAPKLKDLADALKVSSAFLSAVETGKRPAPPELISGIADFFKLDAAGHARLRVAAANSMKVVQVKLECNSSPRAAELAATFARRFPTLDEKKIGELLKVIGSEDVGQANRPRKS